MKIVKNKTKEGAWSVTHCQTVSLREVLAQKLTKYIGLDLFGNCGPFKCETNQLVCSNFEPTYKFYFSFENSLCDDYVSEKLFKVMDQIIIPVVYNGADMKKFLPDRSVSFPNYLSQ